MTITIDIPEPAEGQLKEEADRTGTGIEDLVRRLVEKHYTMPTVPEFWQGYVGVIDGPADLSQDTGRKFADGLTAKHGASG